ncbi:MAG: sugar kinase [Actinomycetota bacterium]|nr:sugar kinase [Actinomycetota bacterium]
MAEFDLLVLGDVNPDLVLRGGDVVPAFAQAERMVEEARLTIGGSGAILACGAARLGLRVAIAGVVGDDLFGRFMLDELAARGVDTRGVAVDQRRSTGVTVVLSRLDDRAMLTAAGTIGDLRASLVDPALIDSARHVHVSAFFLQLGLVAGLPEIFDEAHRAGATTSIDPNWDPAGAWDGGLLDLLSDVDVFLPNAMEAMRLARISDLDEAIVRLRARVPLVVVKNGAHGAIASRSGELVRGPGFDVGIVDTTGSGDSFDAGFLAGFLEGETLERCLALGNACGALSTLVPGGTDGQPTMAEATAAIEGRSARAGREGGSDS